MKREVVTALIAVLIVQSVEGFYRTRLRLKHVLSKTSISQDKPKSVEDVYIEKVCASEPTCDLLATVPEYLHKIPFRGCMCDPECVFYGDCCQDSKYYNKTENSRNHLNFYCFIYKETAIYVKNKCLSTFTDSEVVNKCHIVNRSFRSTSDDLAAIVTDPVTNITYANKYCAKCNRVDNYVSWNVNSKCHSRSRGVLGSNDELREKASHDEKLNKTSEFNAHIDGNDARCEKKINPPRSIEPIYLRSCLPLFSSCPKTTDEEIVDKCASYMSIAYSQRGLMFYRNKYCAKCNGVAENEVVGCLERDKKVIRKTGYSFNWETVNRSGGSGACGWNANEAIMEKFSCE